MVSSLSSRISAARVGGLCAKIPHAKPRHIDGCGVQCLRLRLERGSGVPQLPGVDDSGQSGHLDDRLPAGSFPHLDRLVRTAHRAGTLAGSQVGDSAVGPLHQRHVLVRALERAGLSVWGKPSCQLQLLLLFGGAAYHLQGRGRGVHVQASGRSPCQGQAGQRFPS